MLRGIKTEQTIIVGKLSFFSDRNFISQKVKNIIAITKPTKFINNIDPTIRKYKRRLS